MLGAGGMMGQGMARNAAAADIPVHAWNRTAAKLDELAGVDDRGDLRDRPRGGDRRRRGGDDAERRRRDDRRDAGPDGGAAGSEGAVWVQMGTIGVEGSERCAELARDRGLDYVDAPVLGTKKPAAEGQLVVLASGPEGPRELLEPFFDAIGKRTIWLGAAGQGSKLKVVVNAWLCSITEGTAEMLRLAAALGLEPRLVLDALEDGPLEAPYMRMKGEAMLKGDYTPVVPARLATKDARLAVDAGAAAGAEIPVVEAIAAQMEAVAADASRRGHRRPLPRHRRGRVLSRRRLSTPPNAGNLWACQSKRNSPVRRSRRPRSTLPTAPPRSSSANRSARSTLLAIGVAIGGLVGWLIGRSGGGDDAYADPIAQAPAPPSVATNNSTESTSETGAVS